jgi:phage tail-like protein
VKSDEIAGLLPAVFRTVLQNDATLQTILDTMAAMLDPVEVRLAGLDEIFDAIRTDDAFLPMLAQWVDLSWLLSGDNLSVDPGRLRMLIEESHTLSQERGTADGLVRFLEMATGVAGFAVDDAAQTGTPFHLRVRVPASAAAQANLIARIVDAQKPAYTTWESLLVTSPG